MRTLIYLDESGDLGWSFDNPYQKRGSSRMLTLAAICMPEEKTVYVQRIVRALYKKRKRPLTNELKSSDLNLKDKELFTKLTIKLLKDHPEINIRAITVSKEHVKPEYRRDPNRFYNYLIKLLLLKTICQSHYVDFMPDSRSERVNAKWNLGEYLNQMVHDASFEYQIKNNSCNVTPMDSAKCLELQFIDFYAGLVWSKYEYQSKHANELLAMKRGPTNYKLFFPKHEPLKPSIESLSFPDIID